ncbi:hypothetical protein MPLA_1150042 [Mesorhizobium sp. ORS 3359]|nr:hypothetical protein MPLA_1150042 [Mesorhizobium sp. ORS 3359]
MTAIANVRLGDFAVRNRVKRGYFALAFPPPRPSTDAASLAVATTAPVATLATVRIVPDVFVADLCGLCAWAAALWATPGVTFFGAALPKAGLASFDRSAIAGPAPALACVVLDWVALVFLATGFLLLVAI